MLILELWIPCTLGRWARPSFLLRRAEEWRFEGIHSSNISTPQSANLRRVGRGSNWNWRRVGRRSEDDYMRNGRLLEEGQRRIGGLVMGPWSGSHTGGHHGWTTGPGYSGSLYTGLRCSALHYIYKLLIWAGFARSYSLIIADITAPAGATVTSSCCRRSAADVLLPTFCCRQSTHCFHPKLKKCSFNILMCYKGACYTKFALPQNSR